MLDLLDGIRVGVARGARNSSTLQLNQLTSKHALASDSHHYFESPCTCNTIRYGCRQTAGGNEKSTAPAFY